MTKNITKTIAIVLSSLFLLGLTVFLAYKIYQTRQENLAPTKPEAVSESCTLEFSIKPKPAEPECYQTCDLDNDLCTDDLVCQEIDGSPVCVNPDCPEEENCICPEGPTATPTPSPKITATPTPTPTPIPTVLTPTQIQTQTTPQPTTMAQTSPTSPPPTALPEAGSILPTLGVILGGIALAALGFFFAF